MSCGNKPSSNNTPTEIGPGGGGGAGSLEPVDELEGEVSPIEEEEVQ